MENIHGTCFRRNEILTDNNIGKFQVVSFTWKHLNRQTYIDPLELRLLRTNVNSLPTSDILTILRLNFYNVNISARIHPPLKQRIPLKS